MKSIGLVRRNKAIQLIVYTWAFKLLNQAVWPSCSTNLAGWLAGWTCLYWEENMQRQIIMHPIPTMLKHFFLMSWIVLLAIQMNILLISSVVVLAIGINLVVCSSNSIVISSNSIIILGSFIVVSKNWRILLLYTKSTLLPPMWRFLWDLPHSCTYLQVYYMIPRKKFV